MRTKPCRPDRFGSKRLILFDEVDVYTPIEHDMAGQKQVIPYIVRAANRKTVREIHQEIRTAQVQDVTKDVMRVSVPANFALSTLPSDLHLERENASAVVEEERGDGGYHSSRHVWERCAAGAFLYPPRHHS